MLPAINDVIYGKASALADKLDTGLNPNATFFMLYPYNQSVSLLDVGIQAGQRGIVKMLLDHEASVNPVYLVPSAGSTNVQVEAPLPVAAMYGEDDVIRLLLKKGADINQRDTGGGRSVTALDRAVYAQDLSTVYLLLTHGADINSVLGPGSTVPEVLLRGPIFPRRMVALRNLLIKYGAKMPSGQ
ncbi:MAG: ankyrin repeat domain-containing protein [Steroidobacteraceae bacterium]